MHENLGNFIEGLTILSKYLTNGMEELDFCTATHDQIWFFVYEDDNVSEEDSDKLELLGFSQDDNYGWSYYT